MAKINLETLLSKKPQERAKLAQQSKNPKVLLKLTKDSNPEVLYILSKNKHCTDKVLIALVKVGDGEIKRFVAAHPNASEKTLAELSRDKDWGVRFVVAANKNISENDLKKLSNDKTPAVRVAVATSPLASESLLIKLSKDKSDEVRRRVAGNPNIPEKVMEELAKDKDKPVRNILSKNERLTDRVKILLKKYESSKEGKESAMGKKQTSRKVWNSRLRKIAAVEEMKLPKLPKKIGYLAMFKQGLSPVQALDKIEARGRRYKKFMDILDTGQNAKLIFKKGLSEAEQKKVKLTIEHFAAKRFGKGARQKMLQRERFYKKWAKKIDFNDSEFFNTLEDDLNDLIDGKF